MMKRCYNPHPYQVEAQKFFMRTPKCCGFLGCGMGKTVITLSFLQQLKDNYFDLANICPAENILGSFRYTPTLIICPKSVMYSWESELSKWDHLNLTYTRIQGTEKERKEKLRDAWERGTELYIMSRDHLAWFVDNYGDQKIFVNIIVDELSSFKHFNSKRSRALQKLTSMANRVVGLTGTPCSNSIEDLFGEMLAVDGGEALGKYVTKFRKEFMIEQQRGTFKVYTPQNDALDRITAKISSKCFSLKTSDYLQLPDLLEQNDYIELPEQVMKKYNEIKENFVADLGDSTLVCDNAAVMIGKLLQFTSGQVYCDDKISVIHEEKLNRLLEIVENRESPILCFYKFSAELPRILEKLKGFAVKVYESDEDLDKFNAGEYDVLLAHPITAGMGLNLQSCCHEIVWYTLTWSLEEYIQANARVHRQGQSKPVICHRLICKDTVDKTIAKTLVKKDNFQNTAIELLKAELN